MWPFPFCTQVELGSTGVDCGAETGLGAVDFGIAQPQVASLHVATRCVGFQVKPGIARHGNGYIAARSDEPQVKSAQHGDGVGHLHVGPIAPHIAHAFFVIGNGKDVIALLLQAQTQAQIFQRLACSFFSVDVNYQGRHDTHFIGIGGLDGDVDVDVDEHCTSQRDPKLYG